MYQRPQDTAPAVIIQAKAKAWSDVVLKLNFLHRAAVTGPVDPAWIVAIRDDVERLAAAPRGINIPLRRN